MDFSLIGRLRRVVVQVELESSQGRPMPKQARRTERAEELLLAELLLLVEPLSYVYNQLLEKPSNV